VSEDSALARARQSSSSSDVLQELERNPLPASIEVKLKPDRDAEHVNDVADRLRGFGFVDDVRFGAIGWKSSTGCGRSPRRWLVSGAFAVWPSSSSARRSECRAATQPRDRHHATRGATNASSAAVPAAGSDQRDAGRLVAVGSPTARTPHQPLAHPAAFFSNVQALAIVGFGTLIGFFGSAASVGRHLRRV